MQTPKRASRQSPRRLASKAGAPAVSGRYRPQRARPRHTPPRRLLNAKLRNELRYRLVSLVLTFAMLLSMLSGMGPIHWTSPFSAAVLDASLDYSWLLPRPADGVYSISSPNQLRAL
ncbi:MAG: hypothetical protein RSC08_04750, partial [Oscillospiraceae bacterium]